MSLPYLTTDVPPVPGRVRSTPEDFRVDEVPAYAPSGHGTHLFVRFEKRDFTTQEAVKRLARAMGVDPAQVGTAGQKDRFAVTTQWASFAGATASAAMAVEIPGIRVLEAIPNETKLRTGHLEGNRFELRLRDVPPDRLEDVDRVLAALLAQGMPNYFGEQRFGRNGDNYERARLWLVEGGRAPGKHFERKLLASAFQSELFNRAVADRVSHGELGRVREGELVRKEDTGGMFVVDDVGEAQQRADAWALSPTGPMFGPEMRWPTGAAAAAEEALLAEVGLTREGLARFGRNAPGTRRPVRVRPRELVRNVEGEDLVLAFELPAGSYATALVREVIKGDAAPTERR